jgi:hypothetical protein
MNDARALPTDLHEPWLEAQLRRAWRRQQMMHLVAGLVYLLPWAGGIGLAVLAVDWLVDLPGPVRLLLLVAMLAVGVWHARRHGWRRLRAYRPRRIGLHVECEYPQLQSALVSYVDFSRRAGDAGTSPQLREHVCRQAVEKARSLDFRRIAPLAVSRYAPIAVAVVVLAYGVLTAVRPQMMAVFAERLFNPLSASTYPTDTIIMTESGDMDVPEGGQVLLAARAEGVVPQRGSLHIRSEGRDWERLNVAPSDEGRFDYTIREVYRGFEYRFALGDAVSPTHRVNVVAAPRIERAQVTVRPPKYMNISEESRESLTLSAPEGSQLEWTVRLDTPVSVARLLREGAEAIELTTSDDGRTLHGRTVASASGAYRFHWREREHGFEYKGAKHYLQVALDQEPRVRIDYPPDNERATEGKTLSVTFSANDDHGVAEATLVYRRNESEAVRSPLGALKPGRTIDQTIDEPLKELVDGLKEGDVVTYHIEVSDAYPGKDGPQRASSATRRVQILSEAEYLTYMNRRRQSLLGALRPVYRQQRLASENVHQLRDPAPSSGAGQTEGDDDGS